MGFEDLLNLFTDMGSGAEAVSQGAQLATGAGDVASSVGDIPGAVGAGVADVASSVGDAASGAGDIPGAAGAGAGDAPKPGGGFNFGDVASAVGTGAKAVLPFAQLGATGLGVAGSFKASQAAADQAKIQKRAQGLQERAVTPLTNFGESQLKQATAGQVPAAVQKQIDLWVAGAKQKAHSYLAHAKVGDSSTREAWDAWIDQQGEAMKTQALQSESQQGVGALTGAGQAAGQMSQTAAGQQNSLETLIGQANQQLARLAGGAS